MTTPTTQREADEQAELSTYSSKDIAAIFAGKPTLFYAKGDVDALLSQSRAAIDQSTRQAAPEAPSIARDWLEDAAHENGNYMCKCSTCGNTFIGHKRRVTCKACAHPAATDQPSAGQVDNPLLSLIWRINDAILKALPYHPDSGVREARATKSPANVLFNVESLIRYFKDAEHRASLTPTALQAASDDRIKIGNAMADLLHKLMRGYANRVPGDLINAGAALHRQWYAAPAAPQAASQQRSICHKDAGVCGVGGYCQDCHLGIPPAATTASTDLEQQMDAVIAVPEDQLDAHLRFIGAEPVECEAIGRSALDGAMKAAATPASASGLSDEQIVAALHAHGIDTYPSKYGFDALQVSATCVPALRAVIEDLVALARAPLPGVVSQEGGANA